ncbi:SLAIN motif-containing protein-like [Collichthys lucidus]|uniref:SLAIN motif-containing protein-like n=1 Tax=Collichthys lucidus TaxID=240159 RepID=A0A4V6ASJ0_COLLU|nr:SLAIN motif-containing protein-like [Collichthys lucidus]
MELQDHLKSDWRRYFCNQPPVKFDTSENHHLLSPVRLEGNSDSYGNIWTSDAEQTRVKGWTSQSFAMDARMRLDSLKSGCNSPLPCCNYNSRKESWDSEEPQDEESALDSVELLDVEDDEQDEENWLYESPKKHVFLERGQSALRWCRHVLDNPSPEVEAALSFTDKKVGSTTRLLLLSLIRTDYSELTDDSISTSYRLQDLTDVHVMARIQEASLRQDYVSTPATASPRRGLESLPGLSALSSSSCQSPTSVTMKSCQSPQMTRLHQQVTQFKLLKLAQSRGRTRSPLRTSLRSLQAVRNSRSLEVDDYQPAENAYPPSGASSAAIKGSGYWSSLSAAPIGSEVSFHPVRDSSDRTNVVRRLQRSQSASPCRIPHPVKRYMSVRGRVFASPERSATLAWARNVPSTQR